VLEAWFSLGFGKQHVHAVREPVWREFLPTLKEGITVRRVERADIPALAELDRALPQHQQASPVFSRLPPLTIEQVRADIEAVSKVRSTRRSWRNTRAASSALPFAARSTFHRVTHR